MTSKAQMGRPTVVTDEVLQKAEDYIFDDGFILAHDVVPSVAGLACYLGIGRSTIYDNKEKFSDILEAIEQKQEKMLINNGLLGEFNGTITKLMMTKHGYTDKAEVDNKSSDGSMTPHAPVFNLNPVRPKSDD